MQHSHKYEHQFEKLNAARCTLSKDAMHCYDHQCIKYTFASIIHGIFEHLVVVIGFKSGTIIATCTCLWAYIPHHTHF